MNSLKPHQISAWPILRWSEAASLFKQLIRHCHVDQKQYLNLTVSIVSRRLADKMLSLIKARQATKLPACNHQPLRRKNGKIHFRRLHRDSQMVRPRTDEGWPAGEY